MSGKRSRETAPEPSRKAVGAAPAGYPSGTHEDAVYLKSLIDSIEDGLLVVNRDYRVVKVNKNLLSTVGRREDEVVGRPCYEVFRGDSKECLLGGPGCPSRQVFELGKPAETTVTLRSEEGLSRTFHIHSSPVFDANRHPYQAVEVIRDVTELRQLEARLATTERSAAISKIAANVAHEINNPMAAVATCVEGLERRIRALAVVSSWEREEILQYLEIIKQSAHRCQAIAERLLGYTGQPAFQPELLDLCDLLRDVCRLVEFETIQQRKRISTEFGSMPLVVEGDRAQLAELFLNLLTNALDATDAGDEICVCARPSQDRAVAEVRDSGGGIAPENLERIFEPFFTTKSSGQGTGLGLSICRDIVRQHGGSLRVESQPGSGTVFAVELPRVQESG